MNTELDKKRGKPLYIQLYEAVSEDIMAGRLCNGSRLPSRRDLARRLGISQNTVDSAYKMLIDTGYIVSEPRQGYTVSFKMSAYDGSAPWETDAPEDIVFSPNGIDISHINRAAYAKLLRDAAYNSDIFSYIEKNGELELRSAVSKYLYSFRGIKCPPDRIIIGAGAEYLLASLAILFPSGTSVIMENPCDAHFYRCLAAYAGRVAPLPLNIGKFDLDALYASGGKILFIEPDARFPRSAAMSDSERRGILDWACAEEGRYIVENCCDSEIQWESHKTVYSMDENDRVIYLGGFARSFCPAVKTAYMVLPPELLELWKRGHTYYYALTSKAEQLAMAEFINRGAFTKHYKTMRRVYREKREHLIQALNGAFPDELALCGEAGSTYISARLRGTRTEDMKLLARRSGVKLLSANSFNINRTSEPIADDRLVIGFGDLTREQIGRGIRLVKERRGNYRR